MNKDNEGACTTDVKGIKNFSNEGHVAVQTKIERLSKPECNVSKKFREGKVDAATVENYRINADQTLGRLRCYQWASLRPSTDF